MEVNFCDLGFTIGFLYMTPKVQTMKENKTDELDLSQLKIVCFGTILHIAKVVI